MGHQPSLVEKQQRLQLESNKKALSQSAQRSQLPQ
jgi:hypothetical protein